MAYSVIADVKDISESKSLMVDPADFGDSTYFKLLKSDFLSNTEVLRGEDALSQFVSGKNVLYLNRCIKEILVEDQLATIFDYFGIQNYIPSKIKFAKFLDGRYGKNAEIMRYQIAEGIVPEDYYDVNGSSLYIPVISGAKNNPYHKYRMAQSKAAHMLTGLDDLPLRNSVIDLTLTYPREVSLLVFDLGFEMMEKLCKECFSRFWDGMHTFDMVINGRLRSWVPAGYKGLCRENLHTWSSSLPLLPNYHHHVIIPNMAVIWDYAGSPITSRNVKDMRAEIDVELFDKRMAIETIMNRNLSVKRHGIVFDSQLDDLNVFRHTLNGLIKDYERSLAEQLEMTVLDWCSNGDGRKVPYPVDGAKVLWTGIVKSVFGEYVDLSGFGSFDVNVQYAYCSRDGYRGKVLHWAAYNARSPVVDLNKFFRFNPEVVFRSLDPKKDRVDLMVDLTKVRDDRVAELLHLSNEEMVRWLDYLVHYKNRSCTKGWWKYLRSFSLQLVVDCCSVNPLSGRYMTFLCSFSHEVVVDMIVEEVNSSRLIMYEKPG